MSLFEQLYTQPELLDVLKDKGLLSEQTRIIPWHSNHAAVIDPETGSISHFLYENEMGGFNLSDEAMNTLGMTVPMEYQTQLIGPDAEPLGTVLHHDPVLHLDELDSTEWVLTLDPSSEVAVTVDHVFEIDLEAAGLDQLDGLDVMDSAEFFSIFDLL